MSTHMEGKENKVIRLHYGDDPNQFGDLRIPDTAGPYPVVVVIHGGFWKSVYGLDLLEAVSEDLTQHGLATWNIEYRRVGNEGGSYPGTMQDVSLATDYVRTLAPTYNLDLSSVVVIGHSAGGHLAIWTAGRHRLPEESELRNTTDPLPLKGAISLGGVLDLEQMWKIFDYKQQTFSTVEIENPVADLMGGSPYELSERYAQASPVNLLPLQVPHVLIHGDLDVNVPFKLNAKYEEIAKKQGDAMKVIILPEVEHFEITNPASKVWPTIRAEVMRLIQM
ncbi:alpha/beta hydrolase family protein [Brevibacillus daliensis]|uniref:alpha/beta hydrolase family protein n=1 Tax=Brevibacillus daliensis TaxID=2892995 RepID=UPI001E5D237F|nr:alpha/beta hydrolase [Brevibacillus daliensis]